MHLFAGALGFSFLFFFQNKFRVYLDQQFYEKTIPADFQEGEKRSVQVGPTEDDSVLVVRYEGKYYCLSNACPHFGFSLAKGPLLDNKITCPLHLAQFDVTTGYQEGGPIFKGLEQFDIQEKEGHLHIKVPVASLNKAKTLPMAKRGNDTRRYVIVGGGPAGLSAAETLRQSGFEGQIILLTKENELPYDRTILSKGIFWAQYDKIRVRDADFFQKYDIEVHTASEVEKIDTFFQYVETNNYKHFHYDKLLVCTGSSARIPKNLEYTKELKNIHVLRTYQDMQNIKQTAAQAKNIVIIGASFIGLETASAIKQALKDKVHVTVCDQVQVPFKKIFGEKIGKSVQSLHEQNGITFKLNSEIEKIEGDKNGNVEQIHLKDGNVIKADMVLLGLGAVPNTDFEHDLQKDERGGLITDIFLKTNKKNVYAAGDIAQFPYWLTASHIRVEHYNEAIYQGYTAALNMLGKQIPVKNVPFFWTRFWDKSIQFTGNAQKYDDIHIEGDLNKHQFLAYYFLEGKLVAAAAMGKIPDIVFLNEALKLNIPMRSSDIKSGRLNMKDIQEKVKLLGKECQCKRAKLIKQIQN